MPEWSGKTIGRVRIEKLLALTGFGEVYLGTHLTLERPVTINLLQSQIEEEPALIERFNREVKVVAGLRHPNIVQVFDFDIFDGYPYVVMEYLDTPTLYAYLRNLQERKWYIPKHQVARLIKGVTDALDYAHNQGVIHGNLNPHNIMLHSRVDRFSLDRGLDSNVEPILANFGLEQIIQPSPTEDSEVLIRTLPAYMSPEQALGDKPDHRADIYSLGIILYEMLAGHVPFENDDLLKTILMQIYDQPPRIVEASLAVQEVVNRALEKNPEKRYQTGREMAIELFSSIGMSTRSETTFEATSGHIESVQPIAEYEPTMVSTGKSAVREEGESVENKRRNQKKTEQRRKRTGPLETSVAYPTLLSKGFASPFVLQYYLPQQRAVALSNIRATFENSKINEYRQSSSVKLEQKIRVKFFSHAFDFSEPVTRVMDEEVNKFTFLGTPKDSCELGFHKILISVSDDASGQEFESMIITAQVVDFAFDHISRPLLSRISAVVLGIGSFAMFILGLLEQIDKTVGLTSGTAAGVLAVVVYGNFYSLYQRLRTTSS